MDHVPPLVFFPEKKDLNAGEDLRKDLITAPACNTCNNGSSRSDEYVAYLIATSCANNQVAMNHVASKIRRALERSESFRNKFLAGMKPVILDGESTVMLPFDFGTFNDVMVRVARGLHFARVCTKLTGDLMAISPLIFGPNYPHGLWAWFETWVHRLPWRNGPGCKNPEVFTYRYLDGSPGFEFTFYGGFRVFVGPKPQ